MSLLAYFFLLGGVIGAPHFQQPVQQGHIKSSEINSPSGLAASQVHNGVYYTLNDQLGGRNRIFAVDPVTGSLLATFTINHAENNDWESIAVGPCSDTDSYTCIYIGDSGENKDNKEIRNRIYKVREPANIRDGDLNILQELHYSTFESNCMMVDPAATVTVIGLESGTEYRAMDFTPHNWGGPSVAYMHTFPTDFKHDIISCDISADGKRMIISSSHESFYYQLDNRNVLTTLGTSSPYHVDVNGESVAWSPSGDGYYTLGKHPHASFFFYQSGYPAVSGSTTLPTTMSAPYFQPAVQQGYIKSSEINAPSGLAASREHQGVYYTHNDGYGGENRIFAVEPVTGSLLATFTIDGADNNDWESIAVGPCSNTDSYPCIYIASRLRNHLYKVREPRHIRDGHLPLNGYLDFKWHQGHSECMMVDTAANVYIIGMESRGQEPFIRIPPDMWNHRSEIEFRTTLHLGIDHDILGCDISMDGREMILKSSHEIFYYRLNNGDVYNTLTTKPDKLPYQFEHDGEAIAWTPSGDGYYTLAQLHHAPFYFYQRGYPAVTSTTMLPTTATTTAQPSTPAQTTTLTSITQAALGFEAGAREGFLHSLKIDHPSGLAASHLYPGVYYTMNKGGGGNYVYAVDPKTGNLVFTLTIDNAPNHDWESIAVGPCALNKVSSCIYIGDIGKQGGPSNTLYMVMEPPHPVTQHMPVNHKVHFDWNGKDSGCLMVDPNANTYMISKTDHGVGVIVMLPENAWTTENAGHLQNLGLLNIHTDKQDPTGCDMSKDGREVLIKAIDGIYYANVENGVVHAISDLSPCLLIKGLYEQPPGEAIAWTPKADGFYTLWQGIHAPFFFYKRRNQPSSISPITSSTASTIVTTETTAVTTTTTTTTVPTSSTTTKTNTTTTTTTNTHTSSVTSPTTTTTTTNTSTTAATTTTTATSVPTTHPTSTVNNPPNTPLFSSGSNLSSVQPDYLTIYGMTASRDHPGILYILTNHDGVPFIKALDPETGVVQAIFSIAGAKNVDWEDISVGPGPGNVSCIYIGDIGNKEGPASNTIYRVKEPTDIKDNVLPLLDELSFSWHEGSSSCLMVDPSGNVYIMAGNNGQLAEIPAHAWGAWGGATISVQSLNPVSFNTTNSSVMACDMSQDGKNMLVKTQNQVLYYPVSDKNVVEAVKGPVAHLPHVDIPQFNAVAWSVGADKYYTVTNGTSPTVYEYSRV